MTAANLASRALRLAAKRRQASSSVAPVASGYERGWAGSTSAFEFLQGTRTSLACFSRPERAIRKEDGL